MKICGIPHLAKNERDAPNFLYAALDMAACAAFLTESRMKFAEPTKSHRKSGMWGTRTFVAPRELKRHQKVCAISWGGPALSSIT